MRDVLKELVRKHGESKVTIALREVSREVWDEDAPKRQEEYKKRREKNKQAKERRVAKGEEFKKLIKEGMVVKMRGTRDRNGYREVISFNDSWLELRKLSTYREKPKKGEVRGKTMLKREPYITNQGWDKIVKIIEGAENLIWKLEN